MKSRSNCRDRRVSDMHKLNCDTDQNLNNLNKSPVENNCVSIEDIGLSITSNVNNSNTVDEGGSKSVSKDISSVVPNSSGQDGTSSEANETVGSSSSVDGDIEKCVDVPNKDVPNTSNADDLLISKLNDMSLSSQKTLISQSVESVQNAG